MPKRDLDRERRWRETMQRWRESGQTAKQFCVDQGLPISSFYTWRRELRRRDGQSSGTKRAGKSRFVQLRLEPVPTWLEIELGASPAIRVPASLDEQTLSKVIAAARNATAC